MPGRGSCRTPRAGSTSRGSTTTTVSWTSFSAQGITPYPTLYHWDLPQWVQDAGGWADRAVIGPFADYVDTVVRALGDRVETWTVLNEPQIFVSHGYELGDHAPGLRDPDLALRASHVVNLAHAEAIRAVRAASPRASVGSAFNTDITYPASDDAEDVAAAERHHARINAWFVDPLLRGRYPDAFVDQDAALARMDIRPGDIESMASSLDFIALNMYSRAIVAADSSDKRFGTRTVPGPGRRTSFGWEVWPAALHRLVTRFDRDYGHPPIYITENGCAELTAPGPDGHVHDADRVDYLAGHIGQLARAIDDGCDVRGYFVWSLLDNFEWAVGYTQRFGVVWVDFDARPSAHRERQRLVAAGPRRRRTTRVRRHPGLTGGGSRARPGPLTIDAGSRRSRETSA